MGKYDIELDLESDNSLKMINECITDNSMILEFGPANGRFTKHLSINRNCKVDIVEIDDEAGAEAAQYARFSLVGPVDGNIENYVWLERFGQNKYDYIVFADVLEHLYNPENVLEKCKSLLSEDGKIAISLPNIAYNGIILNLLRDRFNYTSTGLLDDTHIRFFAYHNIVEMTERLKLHIVYQNGVQFKIDTTEVTGRYEFFGNYDTDIIESHPFGEIYQFVIVMQSKPGEVFDKLSRIAKVVDEKYTNYICPKIQLAERERQLAERERQLAEVINSKSWKITAPLRYFCNLFRNK